MVSPQGVLLSTSVVAESGSRQSFCGDVVAGLECSRSVVATRLGLSGSGLISRVLRERMVVVFGCRSLSRMLRKSLEPVMHGTLIKRFSLYQNENGRNKHSRDDKTEIIDGSLFDYI